MPKIIKHGWVFLLITVFLITSGSMCLNNINVDENTGAKLTNPEINIRVGNTDIDSGGNYDFGNVIVNKDSTIVFTIENNGNNDLILTQNIALTEENNIFSLIQPSALIIPLGARQSFSIRFNPKSIGEHIASIVIKNNDLDEGNYTFTIKGTGTTGITYPESGPYGENLLRLSDVNIQENVTYCYRAELIEGAKLKIVIIVYMLDPNITQWFNGLPDKEHLLGWIKGPNTVEEGVSYQYEYTAQYGINDAPTFFTGNLHNYDIKIYENDSVTPTRTKTLIW